MTTQIYKDYTIIEHSEPAIAGGYLSANRIVTYDILDMNGNVWASAHSKGEAMDTVDEYTYSEEDDA